MTDARIVFVHGVSQRVLDAITSLNPEGFTTMAIEGKTTPEEKQIEAVKDADFILWFSAKLSDRVLRSAKKARLVQGLKIAPINDPRERFWNAEDWYVRTARR